MSDFKSSSFSRFAKLTQGVAKATAQLAIDAAKNKAQELINKNEELKDITYKVNAAKEVIKSMSELKGALMKLGQMISITEDMVLPKEISALFKELQRNAPQMSDAEVDLVFNKNFGKKPEELFLSFNRKAIAAASIGQVHLAQLPTGENVAVKVQYPKIVEAIKNDLNHLHKFNNLLHVLFPDRPDIDNLIDELKVSLVKECDYVQEKNEMDFFREALAQEIPEIIIPKTFSDFSTSEILTMELVEGHSFEEALLFSQEEKNFLGQLIYRFHQFSLWKMNKMHSDPQHGNYLFQRNKLIILDFGSTRAFSHDFIIDYCALLMGIERNDSQLYRLAGVHLGFFNLKDSEEFTQKHFQMVEKIYRPYLEAGSYAVTHINPLELIGTFLKGIDLNGRKAPKSEFLHLDRAKLGLYSKLKGLTAEVDWIKWKELYRKNIKSEVITKYGIAN